MKQNLLWKLLFVLFVVGWSLWELYPPTGKNLIEVFEERAVNKDETFESIVSHARELQLEHPEREFANLFEAINTNSITGYFPQVELDPVTDDTRTVLNWVQSESQGQIKLGLDLRGGTEFLVQMDTNRLERVELKERALSQAIEVLRKRLDKYGVAEPIIQPEGNNRIRIQMPGLSEADKETAKTQIQQAAFLEFRMLHPNETELLSQGLGEPGYERLEMTQTEPDGSETTTTHLVKNKPEQGLTGQYVTRAYVSPDLVGQYEIGLEFNSEGARKFAEVTRANVGERLGIVLDGTLYSAPNINEAITGGRASISGGFTYTEAYSLANVLENPLEAPVEIIEERGVDPSLGKDSIRSGVKAAIIGMIAVSAFMLVYYLLAGLVANAALVLNIIVLLGVMCSLDTTLTLPGIAGIVLTIGIAIDANVLIFERIREELNSGKSMKGALSAGYDKVFSTIFDANVTTLISSIILIYMGTGPVRGFGVTLTIGVLVSMFTALVVTRMFFDWMLMNGWLKNIPMLQFIGKTNIQFLNYWKPAFVASWILVICGGVYGFSRGSDVLGVDFKGGDSITLEFTQKVDVDEIRAAIDEATGGDALIQYQKDIATGEETLQITSGFETSESVEQALAESFPDSNFKRIDVDIVGPTVGAQILRSAIVALLLAMFGILVYVAMRYEFSFAIGAVIAVIHDVLMTMGWFCLTGREFSAPMVAAILTIIGFSINDTIVIFDRIREDLILGVKGSFKEIMNRALNKTLARTLITSGTTLLATLSLYIFGGGVINDFAFTFLVGIITGTFSSIYIASAIVLYWHKGHRPKMGAAQVISEEPAPTPA